MDALLIMAVAFVGYIIAYNTYGRFLARKIFRLDKEAPVPSRVLQDGVDYVPTRKGIIFGHHFTSIAGTGPIVGPAIGIIWGWVPALLWVFIGSIVMGAVHDFGALVLSMRNEGKSMSEITARYVNPSARTFFFLLVFLALLIVIAIFGVVIASIFKIYPGSVFPVWCQIPIAITLGWAVYRFNANVVLSTVAAVAVMYATVVAGQWLPLPIADGAFFDLPATGTWTLILLVYVFIASVLPVTTLLQPRDYINAWQLMIIMGLLAAGVIGAASSGSLEMVAPRLNVTPGGDPPPMWPFLFVVIACGAVSGFHGLVSSGTTAKQVRVEDDSLMVGYGSMLMESALAVLVLIAVGAGIGMSYEKGGQVFTGPAAWQQHYATWESAQGLGSKLQAVVVGSANMIGTLGIPKETAVIIIGVFIASFAGTTLDTATRVQRYVIVELASDLKIRPLINRWTATALAVISAGALAFATGADGKGALTLWPMFGAVNQMLAGMALLVITLYLRRRGARGYLLTLLPCLFMLVMTIWAMIANEVDFITAQTRQWPLIIVNIVSLILAVGISIVGFNVLLRPKRQQR